MNFFFGQFEQGNIAIGQLTMDDFLKFKDAQKKINSLVSANVTPTRSRLDRNVDNPMVVEAGALTAALAELASKNFENDSERNEFMSMA